MKKTIGIFAGMLLGMSSMAQSITIEGDLAGDLKGHNKMYLYSRTYQDSADINNGHYTFKIPYKDPMFLMLLPQYIQAERQMYVPFGVLFDKPVTYTITSDISKGMNASVVKGSEAAELLLAYGKEKSEVYGKISKALQSEFGTPWMEETDPKYAAFEKRQSALQQQYLLPLLQTLVKQHPNSYAAVYSLNDARDIATIAQQEQLFASLSKEMKATKEAQEFHQFGEGLRNSAIGKQVKDFSLPDPEGKPVKFSDLKGKYVLIDFWASWCGPCRKSFPHMREVYQQYKDKNLVFYSISIDKSKPDWLKAVAQENNPWLQSLDDKNIAGSGFAITGVPTTYLIGPDGKIMMKEVGFDESGNGEIEKKLAALLGGTVKSASKAIEKPTAAQTTKAIPMAPLQ
ncbi:redoxin domain-containing protein [Chitinophaga sp. Hz27]|uniref:redoxin domain-containing protein n=1 Tax=Chitinophaga sp. Hz27 TaxID=3347169 RepID=UPI0035D8BB35